MVRRVEGFNKEGLFFTSMFPSLFFLGGLY